MEQHFSPETKELLAKAQEVSVDLRYQEVNTYTLFLAQCLLDKDMLSIGSLVFCDPADFQRFYTAQRLLLQYHFPDYTLTVPLPYADELKVVIEEAGVDRQLYGYPAIQPGHLFLAAARQTASLVNRVISPSDHLYQQVMDFYKHKDLSPEDVDAVMDPVKPKGWLSRLFSMKSAPGEKAPAVPLSITMITGISETPVSRYDTGIDFEKTEVEVVALSQSKERPEAYAIVFQEKDGERVVPIVVGGFEAEQLFIAMKLPFDRNKVLMNVLNECIIRLGYVVKEAVVYGRKSGVFLTRIVLSGENTELAFEARPSDAVTLTTVSGKPFSFPKLVFDTVAVQPEDPNEKK